ncbi:MAG: hypothetical protein ABSD75_22640 [Terriglobales bacterium]
MAATRKAEQELRLKSLGMDDSVLATHLKLRQIPDSLPISVRSHKTRDWPEFPFWIPAREMITPSVASEVLIRIFEARREGVKPRPGSVEMHSPAKWCGQGMRQAESTASSAHQDLA